ncbi:flagellar hook-associated protein FlgK [Saccharococcus sp. Marseille-Q5394]|uniref:flagellar hook-associated protein FlgK n=1 Tax=Saccharococcus sp. Marseille-Q5394 TaxID=2972778 RepID=UPI0021C97F5E|nr:flagellar hook-associated protein FlgK [Saccharococcus sp. Marseille-Q5394]
MRSTFMGLETNKRGMFTQQSALYTTGHNISNANTLGYSRQRVNMQATAGFPGVGLNTQTMPGFLGTGVEAGSIQRIRDGFVDHQFRQESNKLGYWESRSKAIGQMEDVLAEPSAYGLQQSLSEFWSSLQTLAANPENGGARAVVVQRGEAVADSFNYMHKSLTEIQTNLGKEIGVSTKDINSMLEQIADLNRQISEVEPNGYMPNDLYDARDILLDELSSYIPIETSYEKSGGRALAIAEGTVTVSLKMKNGPTIELVKGKEFGEIQPDPTILIDPTTKGNVAITGMTIRSANAIAATPYAHSAFLDSGKLKSLVDSYGYTDGNATKGLYPDMIAELNKMAAAFANEMNKVHTSGTDLHGNKGTNFFDAKIPGDPFTAGNIVVNEQLKKDPNLLAASNSPVGSAEVGNGKNAKKLADLQFNGLTELGGSTIQTYYSGVIGELGVNGQQAERLTFNTTTLLGAVSHRRDSISSVSLDEEMTDMIKFQQAYNASARMITVVDETLDKIINGMGVVGR